MTRSISKVAAGLTSVFLMTGCGQTSKFQSTELAAAFSTDSPDHTGSWLETSSRLHQYGFDGATLEWLRQHHVVIVPGFMTAASTRIGITPDYFGDLQRWLSAVGVRWTRAPIESAQTVAFNAMQVMDAVKVAAAPVLLVAHSKGGLDSLSAILRSVDVQKKLRGFIAIQSPFYGTPAGDLLASYEKKYPAAFDWIFAAGFGGSPHVAKDMSQPVRSSIMQAREQEIAQLAAVIPMLTIATYKFDRWGIDSPMELSRDFLRDKYGFEMNDGLVPEGSVRVPGAPFVRLSGIDHMVSVQESSFLPFDRRAFYRTMFMQLHTMAR